jgi:hypothetical protein
MKDKGLRWAMSTRGLTGALLGVALVVTLTACGGNEPTAAPTPVATVEMAKYSTFKDGAGTLWVVGELLNKSDFSVGKVAVAVLLVGDNGKVLASQTVSSPTAVPAMVGPLQEAPFRIGISDPPATWADIKFQLEAKPWMSQEATLAYYDLKIQNEILTPPPDDQGRYVLTGEIVNTGSAVAGSVEVFATGYGSDGKIVDAVYGFSKPDRIAPGEPATIELSFSPGRQIAAVNLLVQGVKGN